MRIKNGIATTKLSDIDHGDVFNMGGELFIMTDECETDDNYKQRHLCVNLRTGTIVRMLGIDDVVLVDAEVIIGRGK